MKKTIKIDFRRFWWYFNPEDNFFTNLLRKDYNVIIDKESPDYVFFSVYGEGTSPLTSKYLGKYASFLKNKFEPIYNLLRRVYYFKRERWKMPILNGDFIKIFYTQENCRPDMNHCDWAFTYNYDEEMKNPKHLRLPAYFFSILKDPRDLIKKNINFQQIKKEKIKFCNFVYSNPIPFRNKFFKKLNRYKKVESWGKCLNNMGGSLPERTLGKGGIVTCKSRDFLEKFKFTIAFENSCYPGYMTEKVFEGINANSIPIFWGNPLIYRDLNTKSFINYHDFEKKVKEKIPEVLFKIPLVRLLAKKYLEGATFKNMIKRIIEIDNDDGLWEEYLKQPWYPNNRLTKYVDENNIRKRFREIFG